MAGRKKAAVRVGRRTIELSNLDKVLFPRARITKGELVAYYHEVADTMLPYLVDRPVSMQRFPDGIGKEGFYQKSIGEYFPDWIDRVEVKKEGGTVTHVVCQDAATLVYLANQGCITPHVWLSRAPRLRRPVVMIFDLDPSGTSFAPVRSGARLLREILTAVGLPAFVQTTGSRGLHVVVPIVRHVSAEQLRRAATRLAGIVTERRPDLVTSEFRKANRGGRVVITLTLKEPPAVPLEAESVSPDVTASLNGDAVRARHGGPFAKHRL